jgi:hypothetical protein
VSLSLYLSSSQAELGDSLLVYTHFGKEVPYSKNWLFLSETLWYDRWQQILQLQDDLQYLEIVTWNE